MEPDYSKLHGHVIVRPDGVKARCGGTGICRHCAGEMAALAAVGPMLEGYKAGLQRMSIAVVAMRRWSRRWKVGAKTWAMLAAASNRTVERLAAMAPCEHFDGRHGHRVCGQCGEEVTG